MPPREILAIPAWDRSPIPIDRWIAALTSEDRPARSVDEDGEVWIEVAPLRLRGYVVKEAGGVGAVHFEIRDDAALAPLQQAAASLGWELHDDDDEDEEQDEEDEDAGEDSDGPV